MINFYEKHCFPVITWNKKFSSKQVVAETNTLEEKVLHLLLLRIFGSFLFRQSKKGD